MRILTWNLERRKPEAPYGKLASSHLFSQSPDIRLSVKPARIFPRPMDIRHGQSIPKDISLPMRERY